MRNPVLFAGLVLLPSLVLGGCLSTLQNDFNRRHGDTLYARDIDYTGAAQRYLKAAVEGNAEAAYRLSAMCCEGSIPCGTSEALDWLTRAASRGHVTAQYMSGLAYLYGLYGANPVPGAALPMLEMASIRQHALANFHLGLACSGAFTQITNTQKALQAFEQARQLGVSLPDTQILYQHLASNTARPFANNVPINAPLIAQAQILLNRQGFDAGKENGKLTEATRAAVRNFQQQQGMPTDGEVNLVLIRALSAAAWTPWLFDSSTEPDNALTVLEEERQAKQREQRRLALKRAITTETNMAKQWQQRMVELGLRQLGMAQPRSASRARPDDDRVPAIARMLSPLADTRQQVSGADMGLCADNLRMHEANKRFYTRELEKIETGENRSSAHDNAARILSQ